MRMIHAIGGCLAIVLVSACTSSGETTATETRGMRPLSEVAASLSLDIRPTGFPEDRILSDKDGHTFYVMADRDYYRFRGDQRSLRGGVVRVAGAELFLPTAMVAAMRRDLASVRKPPEPKPRPSVVVKPPPEIPLTPVLPLTHITLVLDAGHGGKDPGAVHGGVREKDVNLAVTRRVTHMLRAAGATVIPTRTQDSYPSLDARAELANARRADLFLSIHANAASRRSAQGVLALFRADGARGRRSGTLARAIVEGIVSRTQAQNRRAQVDQRGLRVLRKTRMPAVLIEIGFLTNASERRRLTQSAYQDRIARGIVDGVLNWAAAHRATARR